MFRLLVPMGLTGKQKSVLRGLGQKREAAVTVGKAGVTDALIRELDRVLTDRELVKVRLPAGPDRHALALHLASSCQAELAGKVGHTALFYRPNDHLDPSKRVIVEGDPHVA